MKNLQFWKRDQDSAFLASEFRTLGERYVALWKRNDVEILFSRQPLELEHFKKASANVQKSAIQFLSFNLQIMDEMAFEGLDCRNNRTYLWRALSKMQFVPPHNVFDLITDEDVIEVYTLDEHQVFCSFNFFTLTTFSLEEILCLKWKELLHRDWRPLLAMSRQVLKAKVGLLKLPEAWDVKPHTVSEIPTDEKRQFVIQPQMLIPLRKNNKTVAVIATNRGRVLADRET